VQKQLHKNKRWMERFELPTPTTTTLRGCPPNPDLPRDRPGYHLHSNKHARALIESCGRDNVKLQFDLYHCQISEGDLFRSLERDIDLIAHVQIASVPERAEPSLGEIAYANVLGHLDALGYRGHVGCEYSPTSDTLSSLSWAAPYLRAES
jgi:hydroxypyruvate isomerase